MQDRVPLYPGRVTLTPVSGQANTFDLVRADQPTQEGTPLNKASLLKDATAALFGLPNTAVPDDALNELGEFKRDLANYYVWAKIAQTVNNGAFNSYPSGTSIMYNTSGVYGQYGDAVKIVNGSLSIDNPTTVTFSQLKEIGSGILGKYYMCNKDTSGAVKGNEVIYIPETATIVTVPNSSINANNVFVSGFSRPEIVEKASGYALTPNSEAPVEEGYMFVSMGPLCDRARIATGSYTGTGTYGESNPNSLTFAFEPKLVFMFKDKLPLYMNVDTTEAHPVYGTTIGMTTAYSKSLFNIYGRRSGDDYYLYAKKSSDGKTLSWYHGAGANDQMNGSGATYQYIAIG